VYAELLSPGAQPWPLLLDAASARSPCAFVKTPYRRDVFVGGALLLEERQRLPQLTPREREILDLVAEGRTNAEIAEALWVSSGTVRRHLKNVFAELGVHTRTAAAAFVREQRLPFRDHWRRS
jgi:DNA-binding CsgD family transcriptional regulator